MAIIEEYDLSPIQKGMLFHHLSGSAPGVDIEQVVIDYDEPLNVALLERAWQLAVERHPALRTSFEWKQRSDPVQQVHDRTDLDLEVRAAGEGETDFQEFLSRDRARGFDLAQAPLMRLTLFDNGQHRYRLVWTVHHILVDGRAFILVLSDVEEFYQRLRGGEQVMAEPGPAFHPYIEWLKSLDLEGAGEYWADRLRGLAGPTPLLEDAQSPGGAFIGYGEEELRLSEEATLALRKVAMHCDITLNTIVMGVWGLLLSRYSGEVDVLFGATKTSRRGSTAGADAVVGLFLNTVPIRATLPPEAPIAVALQELRAQWLSLRAYEHTPLTRIKEASGFASSAALFDSLVVFENQSFLTALRATSECWKTQDGQLLEQHNFPLTFAVYGDPEMLLRLEFDRRKFTHETAQRMLRHARQLFEGIATNPQQKIAELTLLTPAERQQILVEWNDTRREFPRDKCVHQLFEEQVARSPDAVAVVFEDESLSYAELNRRANQLAHYLRELGVKPDARVAICVERGFEMIVALLGVLKAGGAYIPLDPGYPLERLRFMLEDSSPVAVLTQSHLRELFSELDDALPVLDMTVATPTWRSLPEVNPKLGSIGLNPNHLAYVIYTSGSTGRPKGVLTMHRGLCNSIIGYINEFTILPGDVSLIATSISFDLTYKNIYAPLLVGGKLQLVPNQFDPQMIISTISRGNATLINITPTAFDTLIDASSKNELSKLRIVVFGGEPIHLPKVLMLPKPQPEYVNSYGPTECTGITAFYRIQANSDKSYKRAVPIGRPMANVRIYILDAYRQPVSIGVTGELYIGGAGVGRGYLNRSELTAERFLVDPFVDEPGARMYRTGDLGRWLADGNIEFLGRNDFQVKIRGFRVELGEIEAVLQEQRGIKHAVVIAREDTPGDKRLVAYYTASPIWESVQETLSSDRLRSQLSMSLPEYMVPAAYVRLQSLPLTPSGKLDRKALPAPAADAYSTRGYDPPQGEIETKLATIWAEVLRHDRVGRHDNFFELGGHSLLAVTLVERMRRNGFNVDVRTLFVTPTLADLAATVGANAPTVTVPENLIPFGCEAIAPEMLPLVQLTAEEIGKVVGMVPGGAANVQDIYPLAPLQEGILFHHLLGGEGDPYLTASQFGFDSRARLEAYIGAMQAVIDRHDILRTAVLWEGLPEPVQVVWRKTPLLVEEIELDPAAGDAAEQLYARFNPRRFCIDVRRAPLLRLYVAYDRERERWLMMKLLHHLVGDQTTQEVMHSEVQAHLLGQADRLPKPLPFRNLVAQARLGVSQQEHETFFRQMLRDVDEPTAPFGLLDVQGDGSDIEEAHLTLDADLARRLRASARRLGVSAASLYHLAWARVLAQVSGREDVVFGTVLFGRMQGGEGADLVMGLFINTLPVRISIGEQGVETSVRRTQALLAGLLRHEHASLAQAQRCSAVPAPAPLFSSLLNYRHSPGAGQVPSAETKQVWEGIQELRFEERTNYPFILSVDDLGQGFALTAQTPASIGPLRVCEFMRTALVSLVQALETSPAKAVCALEVLPEPERHRVLYEWNATERVYPQDTSLAALVEAQVERTPDAIAVVHGEQRLTYRELNERANQLAHHLLRLGIESEEKVGIAIARSPELIAGLLAILKAGAAYVPIDPSYPLERRDFMLRDCGIRFLLTRSCDEPITSECAVKFIDVSFNSGGHGDHDSENPPCSAGLDSPAYVMYTSGSTGRPKGVEIPHRGIVRLVVGSEFAEMNENQVFLHLAPISFDASTFEIWGALLHGAQLVLFAGSLLNAHELGDAISKHGVTTLWLTTSLFNAIVDEAPHRLAQLRQLLVGGEALSVPHVIRALRALPNTSLINGYGPTENTTFTCCYPIPGDLAPACTSIPIGRPIANTRVYNLDRNLQPVPVGVVGELYTGGDGLARGYVNLAELTRESFIPDPFLAGERLYKTGDLVRYCADGNLEFLGRADHQVKIRGYRIELGEIETALKEQPGIMQAVVLAREDTPGNKRLVAYYTTSLTGELEGDTLNAERLRTYLSVRLPEYMVPAVYVCLESLPLNPNGKIDRKALPAPEADAHSTRSYEPPQGEIEVAIAAIWADELKLDRVGRHDNFFELGGHSLMAVRLISKIRAAFPECQPSLALLLKAPTVEQFACTLRTGQAAWSCVVPLREGNERPPFFCVHGGGGNVLSMRDMVMHLPHDQPFYGIQAVGLDGRSAPISSVEETAEYYLEQIRKVQPRGPYYLGGTCYGGLVAFEMACRLRSIGEIVGVVAMIDTYNYAYGNFISRPKLLYCNLLFFLRRSIHHLRKLGREKPGNWISYLKSRVRTFLLMMRSVAQIAQKGEGNQFPPNFQHADAQAIDGRGELGGALIRVRDAILVATRKYVPKIYDGHLLVFAAKTRDDDPYRDGALGWLPVARGGVTAFEIEGDHVSIFRNPDVGAIAEKLGRALQEAQCAAQEGIRNQESILVSQER